MRQVEERRLKGHKKKNILCHYVIQNNTSNSCLTDVLNIHFNYNMIFLVNNTRIFEEIPTVSKF